MVSENVKHEIRKLKLDLGSVINGTFSTGKITWAIVEPLVNQLDSLCEYEIDNVEWAKLFVDCLVSYIKIIMEYNDVEQGRTIREYLGTLKQCFDPIREKSIPAFEKIFMINKDSKHNETTTSRTNIPPDMCPSCVHLLILRLASKYRYRPLEISKVLRTKELTDQFVLNATEELFEMFLIEPKNFWCKRIMLKTYLCAMSATKSVRMEFGNKKGYELFRLMDALGVVGDYDTQSSLIEIIFRLYADRIEDEKHNITLIPENPKLNTYFTTRIKAHTFDQDIREFLLGYNKIKNDIFAVPCKTVLFGKSPNCKPPVGMDVIWVDFNFKPKTITWYCDDREPLQNPCDDEDAGWELVTLFESDVKSVEIKRTNEDSMIIEIVSKEACMSETPQAQMFFNQARRKLNLIPVDSFKDNKLISYALPRMFKRKFKHTAAAEGRARAQYRPLKISISRRSSLSSTSVGDPSSSRNASVHNTSAVEFPEAVRDNGSGETVSEPFGSATGSIENTPEKRVSDANGSFNLNFSRLAVSEYCISVPDSIKNTPKGKISGDNKVLKLNVSSVAPEKWGTSGQASNSDNSISIPETEHNLEVMSQRAKDVPSHVMVRTLSTANHSELFSETEIQKPLENLSSLQEPVVTSSQNDTCLDEVVRRLHVLEGRSSGHSVDYQRLISSQQSSKNSSIQTSNDDPAAEVGCSSPTKTSEEVSDEAFETARETLENNNKVPFKISGNSPSPRNAERDLKKVDNKEKVGGDKISLGCPDIEVKGILRDKFAKETSEDIVPSSDEVIPLILVPEESEVIIRGVLQMIHEKENFRETIELPPTNTVKENLGLLRNVKVREQDNFVIISSEDETVVVPVKKAARNASVNGPVIHGKETKNVAYIKRTIHLNSQEKKERKKVFSESEEIIPDNEKVYTDYKLKVKNRLETSKEIHQVQPKHKENILECDKIKNSDKENFIKTMKQKFMEPSKTFKVNQANISSSKDDDFQSQGLTLAKKNERISKENSQDRQKDNLEKCEPIVEKVPQKADLENKITTKMIKKQKQKVVDSGTKKERLIKAFQEDCRHSGKWMAITSKDDMRDAIHSDSELKKERLKNIVQWGLKSYRIIESIDLESAGIIPDNGELDKDCKVKERSSKKIHRIYDTDVIETKKRESTVECEQIEKNNKELMEQNKTHAVKQAISSCYNEDDGHSQGLTLAEKNEDRRLKENSQNRQNDQKEKCGLSVEQVTQKPKNKIKRTTKVTQKQKNIQEDGQFKKKTRPVLSDRTNGKLDANKEKKIQDLGIKKARHFEPDSEDSQLLKSSSQNQVQYGAGSSEVTDVKGVQNLEHKSSQEPFKSARKRVPSILDYPISDVACVGKGNVTKNLSPRDKPLLVSEKVMMTVQSSTRETLKKKLIVRIPQEEVEITRNEFELMQREKFVEVQNFQGLGNKKTRQPEPDTENIDLQSQGLTLTSESVKNHTQFKNEDIEYPHHLERTSQNKVKCGADNNPEVTGVKGDKNLGHISSQGSIDFLVRAPRKRIPNILDSPNSDVSGVEKDVSKSSSPKKVMMTVLYPTRGMLKKKLIIRIPQKEEEMVLNKLMLIQREKYVEALKSLHSNQDSDIFAKSTQKNTEESQNVDIFSLSEQDKHDLTPHNLTPTQKYAGENSQVLIEEGNIFNETENGVLIDGNNVENDIFKQLLRDTSEDENAPVQEEEDELLSVSINKNPNDVCISSEKSEKTLTTSRNNKGKFYKKERLYETTVISTSSRRKRRLYDPTDLTYLDCIDESDNERVEEIVEERHEVEVVPPVKVVTAPTKRPAKNKRVTSKVNKNAPKHKSGKPLYKYWRGDKHIYFYETDPFTFQRKKIKIPNHMSHNFDIDSACENLKHKIESKSDINFRSVSSEQKHKGVGKKGKKDRKEEKETESAIYLKDQDQSNAFTEKHRDLRRRDIFGSPSTSAAEPSTTKTTGGQKKSLTVKICSPKNKPFYCFPFTDTESSNSLFLPELTVKVNRHPVIPTNCTITRSPPPREDTKNKPAVNVLSNIVLKPGVPQPTKRKVIVEEICPLKRLKGVTEHNENEYLHGLPRDERSSYSREEIENWVETGSM